MDGDGPEFADAEGLHALVGLNERAAASLDRTDCRYGPRRPTPGHRRAGIPPRCWPSAIFGRSR